MGSCIDRSDIFVLVFLGLALSARDYSHRLELAVLVVGNDLVLRVRRISDAELVYGLDQR